jgi:hypothetical protein
MQINLLNIDFKKVLGYLGWLLLFLSIWFKGCSSQTESVKKVTVKTPEVKSTFKSKKPTSKPIEVKHNPSNEVKKDGLVYVENPLNKKLLSENEKLKSDFAKLQSDTLKQKSYEKAIELNQFSSKFEDDHLILNVNGIVRGEVLEITPSYTKKSIEIPVEIKQKETYLRVLIGPSFGINKELNRGVYKFDVDFQNKRGDIFSGEYMRVNGQDFGLIGIKKSILNLKR